MKTITFFILAATSVLTMAVLAQTGVTEKGGYRESDALGPISKEATLTLQLIEEKERPIREALQKIAESALKATNDQRNAAIEAECAKYKLEASKGQCYLDTSTGMVKRGKNAPEPAGKK